MKNFLLTFVFFVASWTIHAQCPDGFTATPTPGTCFSNAELKVELPAGCTGNYLAVLTPPQGAGSVQYQRLTGTPASFTFTSLQAGAYTVTVMNQSTGVQTAPKVVNVNSSYVLMNITEVKATAPPCDLPNNGKVTFKIPSGGIGQFKVHIEDQSGAVVHNPITVSRPVGNTTINLEGGVSGNVPSGNLVLVVEDLAGGTPLCGEIRRIPLIVPAPVQSIRCVPVLTTRYASKEPSTCKYKFQYQFKRQDNRPISEGFTPYSDFMNFMKRPGSLVVQNLTTGTPAVDVSSSFNGAYYNTTYMFNDGDMIKVTVNIGVTQYTEQYRFVAPSPNETHNAVYLYDRSTDCPNEFWIQATPTGLWKNYPNLSGGAAIPVWVIWTNSSTPWHNDFQIYKEGPTGVYTLVPTVPHPTHWYYLQVPSAGRYRVVYKASNQGCYTDVVKYITVRTPTPSSVQRALNQVYANYVGVYENTGVIHMYIDRTHSFPLKISITPTNGVMTRTFQTRLPSEASTYPKTVTFPLQGTLTSAGSKDFGDIPAGEYYVTLTDPCGTATKRIRVTGREPVNFTDKVERDCDLGTYTYDFGTKYPGMYYYMAASLERKNASGNWVTASIPGNPINHNANLPKGTFINIPEGEYRVKFNSYRYNYVTVNNSSSGSGYSAVLHSTQGGDLFDWANHSQNITSYTYFKIDKQEQLNLAVSSSACSAASRPYVAASITNPHMIRYPLTYSLVNTSGVVVRTQTYSGGGTSHVFTNVPVGHYNLVASHQCGQVIKQVEVSASNFYEPEIVPFVTRPNICAPANVTLNFTGIETLYDIRWYRANASGQPVGSILHTGQVYTTTLTQTTSFAVSYNLKNSTICPQGAVKTLTYTVPIPQDTNPPVPAALPDITQTLPLGKCVAPVSWTATATDECYPVTIGGSHRSGDTFPLGVTTVTQTFTDPSGNVATRTFLVTVVSNALGLNLSTRYVNGSFVPLTQLTPTESGFYYEIRYKNTGGEHINLAVMEVTLPQNSNVSLNDPPNNQPILTAASVGSVAPIYTYNAATKTYRFVIPGTTLRHGSPERIIRIPLKMIGGCEEAIKPCMNHLVANTTVEFEGGPAGCSLAPQTQTHTATIKVNTDSCQRQELYCGEEMTFSVTTGFDSYQWYKNGVAISGATSSTLTSTGAGVYKVEKTTVCNGVTVVNTETINLVAPAAAIDPIRALANNIGVVCANNGAWTSLFFLCDGLSRELRVTFQNTDFVWQRSNGTCPAPLQGCPYPNDSCWEDVSTSNSFTISTAGKYRLKIKDCNVSYYFDVVTNGLAGQIPPLLIGHQSDYSLGYFTVEMVVTSITYQMELYKDSNPIPIRSISTTSNTYQFTGLQAGNYRVEVTSPQIEGCTYTGTVRIDKTTKMSMTAEFLEWTKCNTARIRFRAEGGQPPYKFAIWSVDGIPLHATHTDAIQNGTIATLPVNQAYVDATIPNVTQIGDYIFVVGDQRNGAFAESYPPLHIVPPAPHGFTVSVTHIQCASIHSANTGAIRLSFDTQQNRVVRLYRLNPDYTRNGAPIDQNASGEFFNLSAGIYETEVAVTISGTTCVYTKKPIEIKPSETTIQAFVGVAVDKDCDTRGTGTKQYKVVVNNVSGGVPPYEYSFDGQQNYGSSNEGYISNAMAIFVKDSKGCIEEFPITVAPVEVPSIQYSPISYRCDNGYGVVTVTMSSTSTNTYEYRVGSTGSYQTVSGTTFTLSLQPGTHLVEVRYVTQSTMATKNTLFKEDFGTGADICMSGINHLTCRQNQPLFDGEYAITQQVAANPNWVNPTPTDPSGGRYLAVMGNGGNEVVYKKQLTGFIPNTTDVHVQLDVRSLLASAGTNANLYVELQTSAGAVLGASQIGAGTIPHGGNWETYQVTFPKTMITQSTLNVAIVNKANSSVGVLGNDLALDNIHVWQDTQYCEAMVSKPIVIEPNKQLSIQKIAETNVSCEDGSDGTLTIKVNNPPASGVIEYAIGSQTTWTTASLTTANTFVVMGLPVTANGVIFVRHPNEPTCMVDFSPYTIGNAIPIVVKVDELSKVTCLTGATILVTATGGNPSSYRYKFGSTPFGTTNQFTNVAAGIYTVTVEDGNGCEKSITWEVKDKKTLAITAEPQYCYDGLGNGIVRVQVADGNGGYIFRRIGDANSYNPSANEYVFTGLSVGTHTFTVTDDAYCTETKTVEVYAPMSLQALETDQYIGCTTGTTVTFTLVVVGGDPLATKQFRVSNDGGVTYTNFASATTTATFSTTTAGNYRFKVVYFPNGDECSAVVERKVLYVPPRFTTSSITTQEAFCGLNNGAIIVTPSDYESSTVSNTITIFPIVGGSVVTPTVPLDPNRLTIGDYMVQITDDRGCIATTTVTVPGVEAMTATATQISPISCATDTTAPLVLAQWQVSLTNMGGRAPFNIKVENTANGYTRTQTLATRTAPAIFTGLDFGHYNAIITDSDNCQIIVPFEVLANAKFIITSQVATPTACATTESIIIKASNPTEGLEPAPNGYWFTIYEPNIETMLPTGLTPAEIAAGVATRLGKTWYKGTETIIGSGYIQAEYIFTNLIPGVQYTFTMYNSATNCYYTQRASGIVPTFSTLTSTITALTPTTCNSANDGSVTFSVSGWQTGTTGIKAQVYNYVGNTIVPGASLGYFLTTAPQTIGGLPAGRYYIVFTENNGADTCVNASQDFTIEKAPEELVVSVTPRVNATCNRAGSVILNIAGGKAPYRYEFVTSGTPTYPATNVVSGTSVVNVGTATWTVYVKDAYGCVKTATVFVDKDKEPAIGTATVMYCSANTITGETPVRITMSQLGVGNHYYTLIKSGVVASPQPINWDASGSGFTLNLEPNTYTLTIQDGNGCHTSTSFVINKLIDYTANVVEVATCRTSVPTVKIGVTTPTGGTGTYSYILYYIEDKGTASETATVIASGAYTSTIVLTSPLYGDYRIAIYDSNIETCPKYKDLLVEEPKRPNVANATMVATPLTCDPNAGQIIVSMPISDPAGFTFQIIQVKDLATNVVTATSIVPASSTNYMATFSNLRGTVSGTQYTIRVTSNDNGCYADRSIIITAPALLTLQGGALSATAYQCGGDGRMNFATLHFDETKIQGGVAPYQVTFFTATNTLLSNGTSYTLPDLNGGSFYAVVTDQNGCTVSTTTVVTVTPTFSLDAITVTTTQSITCSRDEHIQVAVSVLPSYLGTNLTYTLKNIATGSVVTQTTLAATTHTFAGLGVGNYEITITNDYTGCQLATTHQVEDPKTFELVAQDIVRPTCYGDTGSVKLRFVDVVLGNGNQASYGFTYTITSVLYPTQVHTGTVVATDITSDISLNAGVYHVTAKSLYNDCSVEPIRIVIPQSPPRIEVQAKETYGVTCDNNKGEVLVTIKGGQATFTVELIGTTGVPRVHTNVTQHTLFTGLSADTYTILVRDAIGCTTFTGTSSLTLILPSQVTATVSVTQITCIGSNDGSITVENTNGGSGVGTYHYVLYRDGALYREAQASNKFEDLTPGTYIVHVVDAWNCGVTLSPTITLADPVPPKAEILLGAPSRFSVCYGEKNAQVRVKIEGGDRPPYRVALVHAGSLVEVGSYSGIIPAPSPAGTQLNFNNIGAGKYELRITDVNGCVIENTVSLTIVEFPDLSIRHIEHHGTCVDNHYSDYIEVGFEVAGLDFSKLSYTLNGSATRGTFSNTTRFAGRIYDFDRTRLNQSITVYYEDTILGIPESCTVSSPFTIRAAVQTLTLASKTNTSLNTIEVEAQGGLPQYTYYFNGKGQGTNPVYVMNINDPERINEYGKLVKIINVLVEDTAGCTRTLTVEEEYFDIIIPNNFTPDGDGVNDTWKPRNMENFGNSKVYIYDRYGRMVKALQKTGGELEGWDGNYNRRPLPSGDYWYIIEINQHNDTRRFLGNFTLYR